MFGGGNFNSPHASSLKENQLQFDANAAPIQPIQLQLFGNAARFPATGNIGSINYTRNNNLSIINHSNKRSNETDDMKQHELQISLSNCGQDADRLARIANPSGVSTGLRLSYEDDEHNSAATSASGSMSSLPIMMTFSESLRNQIDHQNEEIDRYIRVQEEQVIKGVTEMNQRQMVAFLGAIERGVEKKLHEKEAEIESMNRKNKELNEQIRQAAMEVQSWQSRALYNESVVNSLKGKLMQAIMQGASQAKEGCGDSEVDDAASCQNANAMPGGFFQSSLLGSKSKVRERSACRSCKSKEASVLLMPCRHLCLCVDCERFTQVCPICRAMKSASVAVNMS